MASKCDAKTEVYARVCGFFRPVQNFNLGKREEYRQRKTYDVTAVEQDTAKEVGHDTQEG